MWITFEKTISFVDKPAKLSTTLPTEFTDLFTGTNYFKLNLRNFVSVQKKHYETNLTYQQHTHQNSCAVSNKKSLTNKSTLTTSTTAFYIYNY